MSSFHGDNLPGTSPGYNKGFVQVYEYSFSQSEWIQLGNNLYGKNGDDEFGHTVSISDDGNRILCGIRNAENRPAHHSGADHGGMELYEYVGDDWVQIGDTVYGEPHEDGFFGANVALSGDGKVCVGGSYNRNYVKVFEVTEIVETDGDGGDEMEIMK